MAARPPAASSVLRSEIASFGNMSRGTTVYGKMKLGLGAQSADIDSILVTEGNICFYVYICRFLRAWVNVDCRNHAVLDNLIGLRLGF